MKSSFDDDFLKKKVIIFKIIFLKKFLSEKKYKFIVDENLKLFFQKLKLNFIKMNYVKNDDKLDYVIEYVKIIMIHYFQQTKKMIKKKDCKVT